MGTTHSKVTSRAHETGGKVSAYKSTTINNFTVCFNSTLQNGGYVEVVPTLACATCQKSYMGSQCKKDSS